MLKGIKKGDTAFVIAGKENGKHAKVLKVLSSKNAAVLEGLNLVNRRVRPKKSGEKGGTVPTPMPINASNLLIKCAKCGKATRRSFKILDNGSKIRVCKKCGQEF